MTDIENKIILSAAQHPLSYRSDDHSVECAIVRRLARGDHRIMERTYAEILPEYVFDGIESADAVYIETYELRKPDGFLALATIEREAAQQAHAEKEERFEHKIKVLNIVVPAITFILGLIIEYVGHVIPFLISLFQATPPAG